MDEYEERVKMQQLSEIENQLAMLEEKKAELEMIKQSIDSLKNQKDKDIIIPIGAGILATGKLTDDKNLLVNVGANVLIPKKTEEAKQLIEEQIQEIGRLHDSLKKELEHYA